MASKILIVEDDRETIELLSVRLKAAGYQVIASTDAMTGIQAAHRYLPQLILLDLKMPAGGGLSVLSSLKTSNHTMGIPVLVMSGAADSAMKAKLVEFGIKTFIQKPFKPEDLLDAISKIVPA